MIYLLFLVMFSNQFTHLSLFNMIFHGIQSGFNDTSEGDEEKFYSLNHHLWQLSKLLTFSS